MRQSETERETERETEKRQRVTERDRERQAETGRDRERQGEGRSMLAAAWCNSETIGLNTALGELSQSDAGFSGINYKKS